MSFWDRMEQVVNQGLESSREVIGKAQPDFVPRLKHHRVTCCFAV